MRPSIFKVLNSKRKPSGILKKISKKTGDVCITQLDKRYSYRFMKYINALSGNPEIRS